MAQVSDSRMNTYPTTVNSFLLQWCSIGARPGATCAFWAGRFSARTCLAVKMNAAHLCIESSFRLAKGPACQVRFGYGDRRLMALPHLSGRQREKGGRCTACVPPSPAIAYDRECLRQVRVPPINAAASNGGKATYHVEETRRHERLSTCL
jgi:hypothetical protein